VEKVMKKLVCLLAVLALTAPVFGTGALTITGSFDNTAKQAIIGYTGNDPLGIALVADAGTVAQFTGYVASSADSFFDVFIDYAFSNPPYTLGTGNPLANPNAAGVATLPAAKVSLCLGHLQAAHAGTTGQLAKINVGSIIPAGGPITVTADTLRGSAVDAAGAMTISGLPLTITIPPQVTDCFAVGTVISFVTDGTNGPSQSITVDATMHANYVTLGSPACWCCVGQKAGNAVSASGNASVNNADLSALRVSWLQAVGSGTYNPCADFNCSGSVNNADLSILRTHWLKTVGTCP